jgi:pilus biogenesis lipoprotein CpaD
MRTLFVIPTAALMVSACAVGDRGMVSPHQPVVGADGAYVPNCPDWSDNRASGHEGQSANYGCATATNLAAMIADPADLLRGRSADASSGELASRALKAWREIEPSSKLWTVTTKESVSSAGAPK